MFDKLEATENRFEEVEYKISDPSVIVNQDEYRKYMKEHAELSEIVEKYREYKKVKSDIDEAKDLLYDKIEKDFREMVQMELEESLEKIEDIKKELKMLLIPKDPNDDKNVIVEIRGGAGGEEAGGIGRGGGDRLKGGLPK